MTMAMTKPYARIVAWLVAFALAFAAPVTIFAEENSVTGEPDTTEGITPRSSEGSTIDISDDVTLSGDGWTAKISDFGGYAEKTYTIDAGATVSVVGELLDSDDSALLTFLIPTGATVQWDANFVGSFAYPDGIVPSGGGTFEVVSGSITNSWGNAISGNANVIVSGGTVQANGDDLVAIEAANIYVTGGTVTSDGVALSVSGVAIYLQGTVTGGIASGGDGLYIEAATTEIPAEYVGTNTGLTVQQGGDATWDIVDDQPYIVATPDGGDEVRVAWGSVVSDETGPVLTSLSGERTDTTAIEIFRSTEAGTYYYQLDGEPPLTAEALVEAGTNATEMLVNENRIRLTGLEVGAHTLYIAAKDAAGNVSNLLEITIMPYNPPTTTDATLSALAVSVGEFSFPFRSDLTEYGVDVANSVDRITVTATATRPAAKIAGTGEHPLSVGENRITVTVTAEDDIATKDYVIIVNRAEPDVSNDATLSTLSVSEGTLDPEFDPDVTEYSVAVENSVSSIEITATTNSDEADITGTGTQNLAVGDNEFEIVVTAEDGTQNTYTITVTREEEIVVPPEKYSFEIEAGDGGTITTGADGEYEEGDVIDIAATADEGYDFSGWSSSGGGSFGSVSSASTIFTMPADDTTVTASFTLIDEPEPTAHTITASAGDGGSISPSGSVSVNDGDDQTFTITANSSYEISDVTVDGSSVGVVSSYTFADVDDDHEIIASFVQEENTGGNDDDDDEEDDDGGDGDNNSDDNSYGGGGDSYDDDDDDDDNDSGSSGGGSSSAARAVANTDNAPAPVTVTAAGNAAAAAAQAAQASGSATLTANLKNPGAAPLAAFQAMANAAGGTLMKLQADSLYNNAVDVRITLNPALVTTDLDLSASMRNAAAASTKNLFERFYTNDVATIALGQQGGFGQPVEIAAKIDPAMNTQNLAFYAYDPRTNRFVRIANPGFWVDVNGYVHFTTELAGSIVISDGELNKR